MNTIQLTCDMMQDKTLKKIFRGVFPADKLPKLKKPAMIIANTDSSDQPGSHWVAFFLPQKGPTEVFNSTGQGVENEYFIKFLENNCKKFVFNKKRLQGNLSSTCGQYCAVYLYQRSRNMSFKKFLDLFSNNFDENDEKILKLYKKIFGEKKKTQIGGNNIACYQSCKPCNI